MLSVLKRDNIFEAAIPITPNAVQHAQAICRSQTHVRNKKDGYQGVDAYINSGKVFIEKYANQS